MNQNDELNTGVSVRDSGTKQAGEATATRPVVVGGTWRLDRTHVDAAHVE